MIWHNVIWYDVIWDENKFDEIRWDKMEQIMVMKNKMWFHSIQCQCNFKYSHYATKSLSLLPLARFYFFFCDVMWCDVSSLHLIFSHIASIMNLTLSNCGLEKSYMISLSSSPLFHYFFLSRLISYLILSYLVLLHLI